MLTTHRTPQHTKAAPSRCCTARQTESCCWLLAADRATDRASDRATERPTDARLIVYARPGSAAAGECVQSALRRPGFLSLSTLVGRWRRTLVLNFYVCKIHFSLYYLLSASWPQKSNPAKLAVQFSCSPIAPLLGSLPLCIRVPVSARCFLASMVRIYKSCVWACIVCAVALVETKRTAMRLRR